MLPCVDTRLAAQYLKKSAVISSVRSDGDSTLLIDLYQEVAEITIRQINRWGGIIDSKFAEIPSKLLGGCIYGIKAKDVYAFFRADFESWYDMYISAFHLLSESK